MKVTGVRIAALGVVAAFVTLTSALPATAHQRRATVDTVAVTMKDRLCGLSPKTVSPGITIFKIKNAGKLQHEFQIDRRSSRKLGPGKSDTLRMSLRKGAHAYKCIVPGQATGTMGGTLNVV
jgi:uncharacterized cupredoxin-like copper-binding protein